MQILSIVARVIGSIALSSLMLGAASAGTISTPIIFLGGLDQLICIANNVSNQPITVSVRIIGSTSTTTEECTIGPNSRGGCQHFLNGESGQCRITVEGLSNAQVRERVRGVLFARDLQAPFSVGALVQAD